MMWSRTSTANKAAPYEIGDELAEQCALPGGKNFRQPLRQIAETQSPGASSASSRGSASRRMRGGKPAAWRPARTMRRRDASDLARYQPQPPAVEGAAERRVTVAVAIPAHLEHGRLLSGQLERRAKPAARAAGMNDQIAVARRCFRLSESQHRVQRLIPREPG